MLDMTEVKKGVEIWEKECKRKGRAPVSKEERDYIEMFFKFLDKNNNSILSNKWRPRVEYLSLLDLCLYVPFKVTENNEDLGTVALNSQYYKTYKHLVVELCER